MPGMPRAARTVAESIGALLAVAGFVSAIAWTTPLTERNGGLDSDGVYYAAMAAAWRLPAEQQPPDVPVLSRTAPWCYRVLVPWVVAHLPGTILQGFRGVSLVAAGVSLLLLYALLRSAGHGIGPAALGAGLYAGVFWSVRFAAYSPFYVDVAAQVWIVGALLAMQRRRHTLAAVLLAAGVLTREAALTFLPALLVAILRQPRAAGHRCRLAGLTVLLVAAAFALPRVLIEPVHPGGVMDAWRRAIGPFLQQPQAWGRLALAVFSGCGLVPLLAGVRLRALADVLRSEPQWLLALAFAAAGIFGGIDKARLMLPLLAPLVVVTLAAWGPWLRRDRRAWVLLMAGVGLNAYLGYLFRPLGRFEDYLNALVPMHAPGPLMPRVTEVSVVSALWLVLWAATCAGTKRGTER